MKTYVLTLSTIFPKYHPKAGLPTNFADKFRKTKLHTIRANAPLWWERFKKIEKGEACLSIRQWTGKPYRSPQIELARLTKEDKINIQMLYFEPDKDGAVRWDYFNINHLSCPKIKTVAANDGLSLDDWKAWFKGYDLTKPLAIINFSDFNYK